jgi:hypothetical protein
LGVKSENPLVLVLAVIGGLVVLGLVLKLAFNLFGLVILLVAGAVIYFAVQNATGKGR